MPCPLAGVGKSELAKTLASYYFGSQEAMVRLDMSEFMERHTVSKLIGSPPGAPPAHLAGSAKVLHQRAVVVHFCQCCQRSGAAAQHPCVRYRRALLHLPAT